MKITLSFISAFILLISFVSINSCDKLTDETCQEDTYCSTPVTTCCSDDECVYKYNGKTYPDTEEGLAQLDKDLNCNNAVFSPSESSNTLLKLQQQMDETKFNYGSN